MFIKEKRDTDSLSINIIQTVRLCVHTASIREVNYNCPVRWKGGRKEATEHDAKKPRLSSLGVSLLQRKKTHTPTKEFYTF